MVTQLVRLAPSVVTPYPHDLVRRLLDLRGQWPTVEAAEAHLRRLALAVLDLLDLMGDVAP
ncbi:hypothetical protein NKH77_44915 [Streptomyces sp. M19]